MAFVVRAALRSGRNMARRAADQGYANSMLGLAALYEGGDGVPQVYVLAHMWYNLAIVHFPSAETDLRDTVAVEFRDKLAKKMTPDQIAEAQRLAGEWKPIK